jgi:putative hydrolase of the HAD superfamily
MPVFYVNSNISPKNDDGKEADYIVENFCAWKEVTI